MKPRRLILVRHAHRDKPYGRQADNGLSEKGKRQARKLVGFLSKRCKEDVPRLLSSPKVRCMETLAPFAKKWGLEVIADSLLDEQSDHPPRERMSSVEKRAEKFCEEWLKAKEDTVVACSHGDWLPICLAQLLGIELELKKGAVAIIEVIGKEKYQLTWLVQRL